MLADTWQATAAVAPRRERAWRAVAAAAEAQRGRMLLWVPVAITFGVWSYFGLAREPSWNVLAPLAVAGLVLLWLARARPALALAAMAILGMVAAKAQVDRAAAPMVRATTAQRLVTGIVEDRFVAGRGRQTLIVAVDSIEGFAPDKLPRRLRLQASLKQGEVEIGGRIAAKAMLAPLPSPVLPGGFDYGRQLWLDGIGGTGRILATIDRLEGEAPLRLGLAAALQDLRHRIGARIHAVLDGVPAAIAEALITGERGTIPREVTQSFQISGLAHVLSISGLHMVLVAGGVFWSVRALLAAVPSLALGWPIKKWAAAAALAAGLFYMLLAGSEVATQRSYIMIAVVFFAVLVDRPAISVRNLALAAIILLAIAPAAAISASFQMSFMAVMGLAAYYEFWSDWRHRRGEETYRHRHWALRLAQRSGAVILAGLVTTIVAGAMSSIPAAYHFGRLAPYSVIGNGLALPVISLVIMPMALASAAAMPFGLEAWPLWLMGKGIETMVAISDWVAGLPDAALVVAAPSPLPMIAMALGATLLCLLRGPVRLAGVAIMLAVMLAAALPGATSGVADILIDDRGSTMAFRDEAGRLVPLPGRRGGFALSKWLLANGEEATAAEAAKRPGWTCDAARCVAKVKGRRVAYLRQEDVVADCGGIDILVAGFPLRGACKAVPLRIDRFDLWKHGAHAISIGETGAAPATVRGAAGERPWVLVPEARTDKFVKP